MKKVIIVTGCAGFIGSHFVETVLKNDEECHVIGIDSMTYAGNFNNMASFWDNERFSFVAELLGHTSSHFNVLSKDDSIIVRYDQIADLASSPSFDHRCSIPPFKARDSKINLYAPDICTINFNSNYIACNSLIDIADIAPDSKMSLNIFITKDQIVKINDTFKGMPALGDYIINWDYYDDDVSIVNFAAESHVDRSIDNASPFIETNINGTVNLLELARELNVERFVQISTDEVYGSLAPEPHTEESPLLPSSAYSASKGSADLLALAYYRTHNLPVCITRSSNNYGPRQLPEKVIPVFIEKLLNDEPVPLYGDGQNIRDWLWVKDNCEAIYRVLCDGNAGEVYNIGGTKELKNIELTKILIESIKGQFDEKWIEYVEDRKGHDKEYRLNCNKIKKELSWKPTMSFEQGLSQTVGWYQGVDMDKYFEVHEEE